MTMIPGLYTGRNSKDHILCQMSDLAWMPFTSLWAHDYTVIDGGEDEQKQLNY